MILFCIYLLVLVASIYYTGFFKLFRDETISKRSFAFLFLLKAGAVPVFYWLYKKMYGGIELFDAGKFYHDSMIIQHYAFEHPWHYIKLIFGFQNDSPGSFDYVNCLVKTYNWDNGTVKDYLYNDNRVLIRVHSLLNFLAFDSYFVHALFNCFLSFMGIYFIYRSLKTYFRGKEFIVLLILCLFPSLWFYTGALLKEGLAFFLLGSTLYLLKKLIQFPAANLNVILLLVLLYIDFLLKPYLLLFGATCFMLFFGLEFRWNGKLKPLLFIAGLLVLLLCANIFSRVVKHKSLSEAALTHQRVFVGVAKGGIFLETEHKFIRLEYDSTLVKRVKGKDSLYRIQKNSPYLFWLDRKNSDTLYCKQNQDTNSVYKLVYKIAPGNSNLPVAGAEAGFLNVLTNSLYYSLLYPMFLNAKGPMQWLASFENLFILSALILLLFGFVKNKKPVLFPLVCLLFCFGVCILISLVAPNSGAIFRYRSPVIVFLLLGALYYLPKWEEKN